MNLNELLQNIPYSNIHGSTEGVSIHSISQDSREKNFSGGLFIAVKGTVYDGHDFIDAVIARGAVAIVCEHLPAFLAPDCIYIHVTNSQKTVGLLADNFYGNPSSKLKVIAVTGTNGKTTIAQLLYQSLIELGEKAAVFSTAGDFVNGQDFSTQKKAASSMEVIELHKNLAYIYQEYDCEYVCIEATSHALYQDRLAGVRVSAAVFTNLTQDHLNYHGTVEHYRASKKKLFDMLSSDALAFFNADSPESEAMSSTTPAKKIWYGKRYGSAHERDLWFDIQQAHLFSTKVSFSGTDITTPLVGEFNMYNLLVVFAVLRAYGFSARDLSSVFARIHGAAGRMDAIRHPHKNIVVFVDYAHSPDALENVLTTLTHIPHRQIITVFGVGGGRDTSKRAPMGSIAIKYSDYTYITNDNPRDDEPEDIIRDITHHIQDHTDSYHIEIDRKTAIEKAISRAEEGDIVLIAGKGHETYQEIKGVQYPFSDKQTVIDFFEKKV